LLVNTKKLNEWTDDGFTLNEKAERQLAELVFGDKVDHISEGNTKEYDVQLKDGTKIEIKFTNNPKIFIETNYYDGTPSGLLTTESDYYLIAHTGFWKSKIGKIKLIPTETLIDLYNTNKCKPKSYYPRNDSPGSSGFILEKELGQNDGWLGNVRFDEESDSFDISQWTLRRK